MTAPVINTTHAICPGFTAGQAATHSERAARFGTGILRSLAAISTGLPHGHTMTRLLSAALVLLALPAQAEMAFAPGDLLSARETAQAGAMLACDLGVRDPVAADQVLTDAGWTRTEDEGSWDYTSENLSIMMWTVPGFCMVADAEAGTTAFNDTFLGLANTPPDIGTDADGCTTYAYDGITATLTGPGQDPVCTSDTGAALRFSVPN